MSDVATEILAAGLHREEVRKALLAWFETAKRRSGNGEPSSYFKEDFSRLAASIVAASKADAMIESHMRTVMTLNPLLAAAIWMELHKLIKAVYAIGGLSEISASEKRLVNRHRERELVRQMHAGASKAADERNRIVDHAILACVAGDRSKLLSTREKLTPSHAEVVAKLPEGPRPSKTKVRDRIMALKAEWRESEKESRSGS
jgi:hypothetical protein